MQHDLSTFQKIQLDSNCNMAWHAPTAPSADTASLTWRWMYQLYPGRHGTSAASHIGGTCRWRHCRCRLRPQPLSLQPPHPLAEAVSPPPFVLQIWCKTLSAHDKHLNASFLWQIPSQMPLSSKLGQPPHDRLCLTPQQGVRSSSCPQRNWWRSQGAHTAGCRRL